MDVRSETSLCRHRSQCATVTESDCSHSSLLLFSTHSSIPECARHADLIPDDLHWVLEQRQRERSEALLLRGRASSTALLALGHARSKRSVRRGPNPDPRIVYPLGGGGVTSGRERTMGDPISNDS